MKPQLYNFGRRSIAICQTVKGNDVIVTYQKNLSDLLKLESAHKKAILAYKRGRLVEAQ